MPRSTRAQSRDALSSAAVIPGKTSPVLVTKEMVARMAPGSVIVLDDNFAAARQFAVPAALRHHIGAFNLASSVPYHASQM